MSDLYKQGFFKVPSDATILHADLGTGLFPEDVPVLENEGAYFHIAMESGVMNQITEMIPPSRIFDSVGLSFSPHLFTAFFPPSHIILNFSFARLL
jgi:hypothetical protein